MKRINIKTVKERKEIILRILKEFGRMPTTKLSYLGFGHTEYEILFDALDELVKEGKIIRVEETNAVYWNVKEIIN